MESFERLVYVKNERIGNKNEGSDYYLQRWDREYLLKCGIKAIEIGLLP